MDGVIYNGTGLLIQLPAHVPFHLMESGDIGADG
jgi:hypothetical protein